MTKINLSFFCLFAFSFIFYSCSNFLWPVKPDYLKSARVVTTSTESVSIPNAPNTASFSMISVNIAGYSDAILLGEDTIEVPYATTVKSFKLARFETSYNTWYYVLQWAKNNGYTFAHEGNEGEYSGGDCESLYFTDTETEPKLVDMPVTNINWRDAAIWCNALSEMLGLEPSYYSDSSYTTPIRSSNGSTDITSYELNIGEIDNPYIKENANGYRLPKNAEWEYAARKKHDGSFLSGRNIPGDESGSGEDPTSTEIYNGITFSKSVKKGNYMWDYYNSIYDSSKVSINGYTDSYSVITTATGINPNGNRRTHISGCKLPSHLGFYDMSGNLSEWCLEYANTYGSSYKFSTVRFCRGGDYRNCATNSRNSGDPGYGLVFMAGKCGFRIASNF